MSYLLSYLLSFGILYITFCYVVTRFFQSKGLQFAYQNDPTKNSIICKLVEESKLKTFKYTPYLFSWSVHLQALCFLPVSILEEQFKSFMIPYEREIFHLSEGADIAIDWYEKIPDLNDKRPLLIAVGGLGGNGQCSYMKGVISAIAKKGFKIAFVLYRGTGGLPITTSKLYSIQEWRDIKEPVDYLYGKHCKK